MTDTDEFKAVLAAAKRILIVAGQPEAADSARLIYTQADLTVGSERGIIDIFFRGSLVFRHAPHGEITDYFDRYGAWQDEIKQIAQGLPEPPLPGGAGQRQQT